MCLIKHRKYLHEIPPCVVCFGHAEIGAAFGARPWPPRGGVARREGIPRGVRQRGGVHADVSVWVGVQLAQMVEMLLLECDGAIEELDDEGDLPRVVIAGQQLSATVE